VRKAVIPFRIGFKTAVDVFLVAQLLWYTSCPREDSNFHVAWSESFGFLRGYASYVRTLDPEYCTAFIYVIYGPYEARLAVNGAVFSYTPYRL